VSVAVNAFAGFVTGADGLDTLVGIERVVGSSFGDVFDDGVGSHTMVGGAGDDIYYVDNVGDRVVEVAGEGRDVLYGRAGYQLTPGVSIEVIATPNPTDTTPINLSGNEFAQELFGNNGANVLDGNGGGDQMYGRGGDDAYYVNDIRDRVFEDVGGGRDVIYARAGFQLSPGVEVEVLATPNPTDTTAIFISGNEFAQELFGNAGSNILDGGGGADQMYGRGGDDVYYVDQAGDLVFEDANQGRDVVYTSASWSLGAGQQVEVIATVDAAATAAINLTGNELGQELFGNAGANVLDGRGGADVLYGRGGADTFRFSTALGAGNVDTIADFSSAQGDRIQLVAGVFTGIGASATNGVLNAGAFALSTATAEADDRIIYNPATGALFFDADGSGAQAPVQFATLTGTPADLTAANFVVG
jgi:Ca2+-binding RTX toxin-like protein